RKVCRRAAGFSYRTCEKSSHPGKCAVPPVLASEVLLQQEGRNPRFSRLPLTPTAVVSARRPRRRYCRVFLLHANYHRRRKAPGAFSLVIEQPESISAEYLTPPSVITGAVQANWTWCHDNAHFEPRGRAFAGSQAGALEFFGINRFTAMSWVYISAVVAAVV